MTVIGLMLASWGAAASLVWCALGVLGLRIARGFRTLRELPGPVPQAWPRLSVIVPACDEEATIGPALATLLAQDYPDLEVVAVDDRSTDRTGRILDDAAARNDRLRVVHVASLPAGWLGKVHALARGVEVATGDYLLFTDADVHFQRDVLRRAVAYAIHSGTEHLTVAPEIEAAGVLHQAVGAAFMTSFLLGTRALRVGRPGSRAYVGIGAFNLVQRRAFERTRGFAWLRLEILDDVGLGLMMRDAGARASFAVGLGDVAITWYASLGAMARGLEKNMFGAFCRYRASRLVAFVTMSALVIAGPLVALAAPPRPWLPAMSAAALALVVVNAIVLARRTRRPATQFLLAPVGAAILTLLVVRSAWRCVRDGGVTWRGSFYPLDDLREGQRVKL